MKGFKMMGLTLAASSIAFSLSQVAHANKWLMGTITYRVIIINHH